MSTINREPLLHYAHADEHLTSIDSSDGEVLKRDVTGPAPAAPVAASTGQMSLKSYMGVIGILLGCQVIWSVFGVWTKSILNQLAPEVFSSYRDFMASSVLLLFAWWRENLGMHLLRRANWKHAAFLIGCGLCLFINKLCGVLGIQAANPTAGSMMQPLIPAWSTMLSVVLALDHSASLRNMLERRKQVAIATLQTDAHRSASVFTRMGTWCQARLPMLRLGCALGVSVSIAGACVILASALRNDVNHQKNPVLGLALFAINTFALSVYVIAQKWAFQPSKGAQITRLVQEQQLLLATAAAAGGDISVASPTLVGSPMLYSPENSTDSPDFFLSSPVSEVAGLAARRPSQSYSALADSFIVPVGDVDAAALDAAAGPPSLSEWQKLPITLTALCYTAEFFCMLIAALPYVHTAMRDGTWHEQFVPPPAVWGALAFGGIISGALCFTLLCYATTKVPPPLVTAFWPLQIPMVAFGSYLAYEDRITGSQAAGGGIIVLGMLVLVAVNMRTYRMEREAAAEEAAAACHLSPEPVIIKADAKGVLQR